MYSRKEASQVRQEFWTTFGKYMQPVLSSGGEKVNWINYKTGAKNIYFRMHAGKGASVAIELRHADAILREEYYNRFLELRSLFNNITGEKWTWHKEVKDEHGRIISRIDTTIEEVNVFNKADWPALISFFKPRIIALDGFWGQVKHEFDVW
jgi:hypothetical protein